MPRFSPGDVLAGRFRIVRYIDAGGMGEVYEAEDASTSERIAVKIVHPRVAAQPDAEERLRREVGVAECLPHRNVCRTRELLRDGETLLLTMDLLDGETLEAELARYGRMTAAEALPIALQMASALSAAHDAGIVHGDFKSGNVMLVPGAAGDHRAVVTDFGTAGPRTARADAGPELVIGTPAYMAPEQAKGDELTPAADIFALGVVLYEMRTGRLPQEGETIEELLEKRVEELTPMPHEHAPDLEARWELVILQCLQPEPEDRFASVRDVERALLGQGVARSPRARREARRRRWLIAGAAVATVVGVLLTAWLTR